MTIKRPLILTTLFAVLAIGTVVTAGHFSGQFLASNTKKDGTVSCHGKHTALKVVIKDNVVTPDKTTGKLCDTLTFTNEDPIDREIAFGPHENHIPYDGVAERLLSQSQSLTITLNQAGSFHFHDHIHDEVEGYFTVTE